MVLSGNLNFKVKNMKILNDYFRKMSGTAKSPKRAEFDYIIWSFIGSFTGIAAVAFIHFNFFLKEDLVLIIGSFGASAVLIYGAVESPLAQPRNLIGGHILSAFIGVTCWKLLGCSPWLASALSVSLAIFFMHLSKTLHPPGGATALIAVIGNDSIHALGYKYMLIPAGTGALIMLIIALGVNNIPKNRKYPQFWL